MRTWLAALSIWFVGCVGWRGECSPVVLPSPPEGMQKPMATFSLQARTTRPARWYEDAAASRDWLEAQSSASHQAPWAHLVAQAMLATGWFAAVTPVTAVGDRSPVLHFDFELHVTQAEYVMVPLTGVIVPVDVCVLALDLLISLWPQRLDHTIDLRATSHGVLGSTQSSHRETTGRLVALWLLPALPFATLEPDDLAVRDAVRAAVAAAIERGLFASTAR